MTFRVFFCVLFVLATFSTGCVFSRKNRAPKESPLIAGDVEETFKRRWVEQRASQLVAEGLTADLARSRAAEEFDAKYDFNRQQK